MTKIMDALTTARKIDIYLAWQKIADGRIQIRRYSPNAYDSELKLFEKRTPKALQWLEEHGHPEWPCKPNGKPFMTRYKGPGSCEKI
jgi:hypothetical protein